MLDYLKESQEEYAIINLVGKIAELAEKYPFVFLKLCSLNSGTCSIDTYQSICHDLVKWEVLELCFPSFQMQKKAHSKMTTVFLVFH